MKKGREKQCTVKGGSVCSRGPTSVGVLHATYRAPAPCFELLLAPPSCEKYPEDSTHPQHPPLPAAESHAFDG